MDYNDNRYLFCSEGTFNLISEAYILGNKSQARVNLAGNRYIVEVGPGTPYYNLSFAKTHQEALEIVAGPEWTADDEFA